MLYYGCWNDSGHYLYDIHGRVIFELDAERRHRCPFVPSRIDAFFAPRQVMESEDVTTVTHIHGWTVLAMWDRSVDGRPGSNAAFLMEGHFEEGSMWARASLDYPHIVERLKAAKVDHRQAWIQARSISA